MAVRVLVARLDDLAGQFERVRAVVLAPAVMRIAHDRDRERQCRQQFPYTRCSTHDFTDCSAPGNPAGLSPPACAMSGRPPPLPPTCCATKLTSSPAFTLAVRSEVTPAISDTLPSFTAPSTIAADLSLSLLRSTVSRLVLRSASCSATARARSTYPPSAWPSPACAPS